MRLGPMTLLLAGLAALVVACSAGSSPSPVPSVGASPAPLVAVSPPSEPSASTVELTIYGAASLKGALERVKTSYEAALPGATIVISTDSSAALATQIEQGAPADIFLSADTTNPLRLVDGGFADGAPVVFAGNELTIAVPTANPGVMTSPADLARAGVKVIAAGDEVPITQYANQLVAKLAMLPGYPADFAAAYAANVVSKEDNVKAVIAKIELGEGDAGIVYVTDAAASTDVATIDVPDAATVRASYAGIVVAASRHRPEAHAFLDWLVGADGQADLADLGFLPPGS